jgi:hypothetical protein
MPSVSDWAQDYSTQISMVQTQPLPLRAYRRRQQRP